MNETGWFLSTTLPDPKFGFCLATPRPVLQDRPRDVGECEIKSLIRVQYSFHPRALWEFVLVWSYMILIDEPSFGFDNRSISNMVPLFAGDSR